MSSQVIAYGGTMERSLDGTAWEVIPAAKGIVVPSTTRDYVDATSLDSPNGFREYVPGLKDTGEITLSCGYTADGFEQQVADAAHVDSGGGAIYYRATLPLQEGQTTGDTFEFRGFPTPSLEANDVGGIIAMNIAIRTTGDYTYTRGTDAA